MEEIGEMVALKTSKRYFQPTIEEWDNLFEKGKRLERYHGFVLTILHDPIKQLEMEGQAPKRSNIANQSELRKKIGSAKSADEFAVKKTAGKGVNNV